MKIIAIDIGNTHTRLCLVEKRKVSESTVHPTDQPELIEQSLRGLFGKVSSAKKVPVAICSVVPAATDRVTRFAKLSLNLDPKVIGRDIPLPLETDLKDARTVGADRVVSAAMAFERMGKAAAVATFGTAITIDCVNEQGVFLGGAILPGLGLSARALKEHTAQLPLVTPEPPETVWGRDTSEAIGAGLIFGAVGALREIVERYAMALGHWPELIVTGGDGALIARECDFVHAIVPELLLVGIEATYEKWLDDESE